MNSGPTWLGEVLDVLEHRRRLVVATAVGVCIVGFLGAYLLPDIIPANPFVGAAVGLAAALLATAVALGVDSVDLTVRGARHVRAAGADVVGLLAGRPDPDVTTDLAGRLVEGRGGPIRIALAPSSRAITTVPRWTDALAVELSRQDQRVVILDLASGPDLSGHPGVLEVVRDGLRLGEAVRFDPELLLARLGPGADEDAALAAWPRLAGNIPSDVDVLLVALPPVTQPGVIAALGAADRAWLFATIDRTARVDLIAGLDAADRTGTPTEVVLLDPSREHPAPTTVGVAAPPDAATELEPGVEQPEGRSTTPEVRSAAEQPAPWKPSGYPIDAADGPDPDPEPKTDEDDVDDAAAGGAFAELSSLAAMSTQQTQSEDDNAVPGTEELPDEPAGTDDEAPAPSERAQEPAPERSDTHVPDPTDELPPIVLDGPVQEPQRWAPPDDRETGRYQAPLAGPEHDDDPVRVAAALQTLAQEVWSRDEEA